MSRMVETDDGWVNLDHVKTVRRDVSGTRLLFMDDPEHILGCLTIRDQRADELLAQVIPAAAGSTAYAIQPGLDGELFVDHILLVGWRLISSEYGSWVEPIVAPSQMDSSTTILIAMPDGRVWDPKNEDICETLEEAKARLLQEAQKKRDEIRPAGG
jgi:hypothetical protein